MGKGIVRITNDLIKQALNFPMDWEIESISQAFGDYGNKRNGESVMLISGDAFPETNNRGDAEDCELIVHQAISTVEVKRSIRKEKG